MCGALEQGACESRGKPRDEAGGTGAVENAGEGYSAIRPVEALEEVGCGQHDSNKEGSSPPGWGWVPRDSPPTQGAGDGRPAGTGLASEARSDQQDNNQPPTGPPLAGSSGGGGARYTREHQSSFNMPQDDISQLCLVEEDGERAQ